jgi:hypothetical protein
LMRKFACCYAQGKPGARHFRTNVVTVSTPAEFKEVVDRYFPTVIELDRAGSSAVVDRFGATPE